MEEFENATGGDRGKKGRSEKGLKKGKAAKEEGNAWREKGRRLECLGEGID